MGLVDSLSAEASTPFGLYLVGPDEPLADDARRLEASVFFETFGNTPEMLAAEYGPYDDVSVFIVVLDHHRARVAGMIRLILDGHGSLKSMTDIEHEPWSMPLERALAEAGLDDLDTAEALDVTTLAVDPEYRGAATSGLVSLALYQAVVQTAMAGGFRWLVTILDVVVLDLINGSTQAPFRNYPGVDPMRYLDSPSSVPVWCDFAEYQPRLRSLDPSMGEILFDGSGMEAAVAPADYERAGTIARSLSSTTFVDLRDSEDLDLRDPVGRGVPTDVDDTTRRSSA